ncbi:MAG TPA: hypothetical protein VMV31_12560, partial [Terriglobales bacterium]|nr:hypothetical protein [Terriglobales bacterium]
ESAKGGGSRRGVKPKLRTQTAPKKVNAMESDQPQAKPKCERFWTLPGGEGQESNDDCLDACAYLSQGLAEQGLELPKIHWIEG